MKIVGICGSTGSGKSTLCTILAERGFPVFDCDEIYHNLVNSPSLCLTEICNTFGEELCVDGKLDRKALGKIVFSDSEKMKKLNGISHYHVSLEIQNLIKKASETGALACFIDAPMLFESGLDKICEFVCGVVSDRTLQIQRVCERDSILPDEAEKRLSNQISPAELFRKCDFIVENDGDLENIKVQCENLLKKINLLKG